MKMPIIRTLAEMKKEVAKLTKLYKKARKASFVDEDSDSYFTMIRLGGVLDGLNGAIGIVEKWNVSLKDEK